MSDQIPLKPVTAFFAGTARTAAIGELTITERPDMALASLARRAPGQEQFDETAESVFSSPLPEPGQMTESGSFTLFWTAPDQWMVTAPFDTHELISSMLTSEFNGSASVTEQTDAWVILDVDGSKCLDLFRRLCAIDIEAFGDGQATRTLIHHLGCFVLCLTFDQSYRILCPRSSAASLWHALEETAHSIA